MPSYFYEDDNKKVIREALLTDKAKAWAESFINAEQAKERGPRNPRLTSAQLRKFHIEAKELEVRVRNLKNPKDDFLRLRPLVKMLKSKVAYACPTDVGARNIPIEFRKYIEEMVDNVEDSDDFRAFALCFESVVGFFYGQGGR